MDFRLTQIVKKLDRCEARLLELQLQEIALKHAGDQTAQVINKSQREMLQLMIEELKETSSNLGQSSGDLEARKDDLMALRRDLQLVRADMQKLEIELDGPRANQHHSARNDGRGSVADRMIDRSLRTKQKTPARSHPRQRLFLG